MKRAETVRFTINGIEHVIHPNQLMGTYREVRVPLRLDVFNRLWDQARTQGTTVDAILREMTELSIVAQGT